MNHLLKKTSFISGIILLFAPLVFSSIFKFAESFLYIVYTFNPEKILSYVVFLVVIILEVIFFIKFFKAYRLYESYVYYLVYVYGIITALGIFVFGIPFITTYQNFQYLQIIRIIFFFVLLFSLFSFRYQKENFITTDNLSEIRNNLILFLILAAIVGEISHYVSLRVFWISAPSFHYFLTAIISLILIPFWRKRVPNATLREYLFFPGFFIITTELALLTLSIPVLFFKTIQFLVTQN